MISAFDDCSVNKLHDVCSSFHTSVTSRARSPRTINFRSNIHTGRARERLGRDNDTLCTIPTSGVQARKLCKQMGSTIPQINHTQVAQGRGTVKFHKWTPSPAKNTSSFLNNTRARNVKTRCCSRNVVKGRHRGHTRRKLTGHVPQVVHETQTGWYPPPDYRSFTVEQNDSQRNIQDGNSCLNKASLTSRRTHASVRSQRCLLSHPYKTGLQKIHEVHTSQQTVWFTSTRPYPLA